MSGARDPLGAVTRLEAAELRVTLGGRPVLAGVSAAFARGQVTAILGPNGAGKSTLLACLAALRRPDRGTVTLGDRPLAAWSAEERARALGFLPQLPEIAWPVSVETLVALGRLPHRGVASAAEDRAAVAAALATVGMSAFARRDATSLSGGERARVLLARALAGAPRFLLADEPLAGLDPGRQFDAIDLFRAQAAAGLGVVLTLHDLPLAARVADRVLLLHEGRIVADGPPAAVLTAPLLATVYGIEARVTARDAGLAIELVGRR